MKPQNQPPTQQAIKTKTPSTKPSITGGIFSILALIVAGIAHFLTHAESRTNTEVTTPFGKVDDGPVADIAEKSVTGILSMPFIVVAVLFAIIAIIFTLIRLRKVKVTGLVFSLIWLGLSIWAIVIASGAMQVISADPVS